MAAKKIKEIIIVGSNSSMAKSFTKNNEDKYSFLRINRKNKYNLKYLLNNNLKKNNDYFAIIYFIGKFKRSFEITQNDLETNFLYLKKVLDYNYKSYLKKKRHIKFITITSLDATFPNSNSVGYSSMKSASSHLILNYQKLHKNTKISYFDIQPGAVKTKMRTRKIGNALKVEEINKTIEYILGLSSEVGMFPIKIFPKLNNYAVY
jgi:hypothetical protein